MIREGRITGKTFFLLKSKISNTDNTFIRGMYDYRTLGRKIFVTFKSYSTNFTTDIKVYIDTQL